MNVDSKIADMTGEVTESLSANMAAGQAQLHNTQTQVKHGMEKVMRGAEDFMAFGQGNVEAMVKSGQIWAAGVQDLGKQVANTAQSTLEETMATFKAMAGIRSIRDVFELQSSYARSAMEKAMAETGKLTDASFKLAEQAVAPLTARVSVAVEKFAKAS